MKKQDIGAFPKFFDRYIHKVPNVDVLTTLEETRNLFDDIEDTLISLGRQTYQEGKWTINQVLQHIIDNERIQSSRALRIIRGDNTQLPGYDQDIIARDTHFPDKPTRVLLREYKSVRDSTILLYQFVPDAMIKRTGLCSNIEISALSIGFVISGHAIHHKEILRSRYLVGLD